jgi:GNAT superfamily N-acetyltransferase
MALTYRPVQWTDLETLGALYAAMVAELHLTYPVHTDAGAELIAWLAQDNPARWIAEVAVRDALPNGFGWPTGGTPVGVLFAHVEERSLGRPRRVASTEWLYVRPEHRAGRIAPTLMRRAIRRAKAAGCEVVEAAFVPGTDEQRRWERFGFGKPYLGRAVLADARYARLTREEGRA